MLKYPTDLWIYQELIVERRPDLIIETGTHHGGSALFMAMICDQLGAGEVVSVDIDGDPARPSHPRIEYITASSTDPGVVADLTARAAGKRVMVILDSDHSEAHVAAEMRCYAPLVQVGDYLIVEDSNINGHPTFVDFGPGPMEAIDGFLGETDEFVVDEQRERLLMTLNPRGYLRRVASGRATA